MTFIQRVVFLALGVCFASATVSAYLPECNGTIRITYYSTNCSGHWCEDEVCASCPECDSRCSCDLAYCWCMSTWIGLSSCWNENCDAGGIARGPGVGLGGDLTWIVSRGFCIAPERASQ
jgi:hypothetical protein